MPRQSRRNREPEPGPSNRMEVDSDSDSDEQVSVSQVSRNMKKINVSQASKRGKARGRQMSSSSEEEEQEARAPRNTQKMNGTQKGQRKTNARQIDSDSEEEPQPSTSQATQKKRRNNASQSQRAHHMSSQASTSAAADTLIGDDIPASQISPNTSLTEQEHNLHVANVVKYILSADQQNKTPIARAKISKAMNCHNKNFKEVFNSAQEVLRNVFGYEMLNVEDENDRNQGKQKVQKFILLNTVGGEDLNEDADEETATRYMLLFLSLTHIFMSGTKSTEESLRNFLIKLRIVMDHHTQHEQFGDAMETIMKDFVKEEYINVSTDKELTWGVRAIKELKPRSVMEFVSQIYDNRDLNSWPREHENMLRMEEANQRPNGLINGTQH